MKGTWSYLNSECEDLKCLGSGWNKVWNDWNGGTFGEKVWRFDL